MGKNLTVIFDSYLIGEGEPIFTHFLDNFID